MKKDNNIILSNNLTYYMDKNGIDRTQLCKDLDFCYSTVSEWLSAKKYPRMDKIEKLANYFGIKKSDLIESKQDNKNMQISIDFGSRNTILSANNLSKITENENSINDSENTKNRIYTFKEEIANKYHIDSSLQLLPLMLSDVKIPIEKAENDKLSQLLISYNKLNDIGKEKAVERIEELTEIDKYKK